MLHGALRGHSFDTNCFSLLSTHVMVWHHIRLTRFPFTVSNCPNPVAQQHIRLTRAPFLYSLFSPCGYMACIYSSDQLLPSKDRAWTSSRASGLAVLRILFFPTRSCDESSRWAGGCRLRLVSLQLYVLCAYLDLTMRQSVKWARSQRPSQDWCDEGSLAIVFDSLTEADAFGH